MYNSTETWVIVDMFMHHVCYTDGAIVGRMIDHVGCADGAVVGTIMDHACYTDQVMFFDEPTTGLDPGNRRLVWRLMQRVKKGRIIVLTTHSTAP